MNAVDKKKEKVKCPMCEKLLSRGYLKTHLLNVHQSSTDERLDTKDKATPPDEYTVDNLDEIFIDEDLYDPDEIEFLKDFSKMKIQETKSSRETKGTKKTRKQPELAIQKKLEKQLNGSHQTTPAGIIDIVSNEGGGVIVEIKEWKNYKAAIGQLFCYGYYYPNHMKRIHFFGTHPPDDLKVVILTICASLRIAVTYEKEKDSG